ncbi:hypothetical protein ACH427_04425 [Streptomyces sp. NPDC020379]|uniref:hypothetical protein n=1 Tax=Streptomyces sp. NPDC020379 TaxID=3365071 RepID=UPI00379F9494
MALSQQRFKYVKVYVPGTKGIIQELGNEISFGDVEEAFSGLAFYYVQRSSSLEVYAGEGFDRRVVYVYYVDDPRSAN